MISIVVISKDEPALRETLAELSQQAGGDDAELIVVDASSGRLDDVRRLFPTVVWIDYEPGGAPGAGVTIPHQRNVGLRAGAGDVVVFTDAGCELAPGWLRSLTAPILDGSEEVTAGPARGSGPWGRLYDRDGATPSTYLDEAPTINLALHRRVVERVGDFDEAFEYGSDIDYTWRVVASGARIRAVPEAVVTHDWGSRRRQVKRSYRYGKARVRLHRKHATPLRALPRREPLLVVYPAFLLGLPLALVFPPYVLLLAVPAWRARRSQPLAVVVDHLAFGAGALVEALR